jgi:hypothetical protein
MGDSIAAAKQVAPGPRADEQSCNFLGDVEIGKPSRSLSPEDARRGGLRSSCVELA